MNKGRDFSRGTIHLHRKTWTKHEAVPQVSSILLKITSQQALGRAIWEGRGGEGRVQTKVIRACELESDIILKKVTDRAIEN